MTDKHMHAIAGALAFLAQLGLLKIATMWGAVAAGIVTSIALGVAWEVVQRVRHEGEPDPMDAVATAGGGAAAAVAMVATLQIFAR